MERPGGRHSRACHRHLAGVIPAGRQSGVLNLCVALGVDMTIEDSWGGGIATGAIAHVARSTPPPENLRSGSAPVSPPRRLRRAAAPVALAY
ncbi:MAG: hypothetical protein RBS80_01480 [Thermoguttaceae bacterium]|jgi:hypothetical protein|nr:hypothetical protein [Thermoguttaceae bacterium]